MRRLNYLSCLLVCALPLAAHTRTVWQSESAVVLQTSLNAGQEIAISGINGDVVAEPSSSGQVEVVAELQSPGGEPGLPIRLSVEDHEGGTRITALPFETNSGLRFHVRVPDGIRFRGSTRNGRIRTRALGARVEAHTVNGDIDIESRDSGEASTVNGSIKARLGRDAHLETVNGSLHVAVPASVRVRLNAQTVHGAVTAAIPFTHASRVAHNHAYGAVRGWAEGAPVYVLRTVNGNISVENAL